jgi:transcriptional regulator GlxA family with amidase domain
VAQRLRAAEERMRLGFAEEVDFAALAREAGLSRRTFFRRWSDIFRDTPQAHLREIRLLNAARGLVLDSRSVSEVAVSCGFPNPAYFSALFRRRFGASPQRYRSQQLKTLGWREYHGPIT